MNAYPQQGERYPQVISLPPKPPPRGTRSPRRDRSHAMVAGLLLRVSTKRDQAQVQGRRSPAGPGRGPEFGGRRPQLGFDALGFGSMGQTGPGGFGQRSCRSADHLGKGRVGSTSIGESPAGHFCNGERDILKKAAAFFAKENAR